MAGEPAKASLKPALLGIAIVVVLAAAAITSAIVTRNEGPTTIVQPTADVITAVRDLARLEGAQFHVERVVDLTDRDTALAGLVTVEDAILLVAAGDVVAGCDLSRMRDGDVVVDAVRHHVEITLPAAEIFSARLDSERTYVHSRTTDLLARPSHTLETRARQEAERTMRQAALESGVLDRAGRNVEQTVRALVRSLGYASVAVHFRSE